MKKFIFTLTILTCFSCTESESTIHFDDSKATPFLWNNANIYFLMTDRFYNGNPGNDLNFNRTKTAETLRGFEGGDLQGITQKINEGYFSDLGINAIWITPIVEQVHDAIGETGFASYGFHGYWAKDWTALDPNFGTEEDLRTLVNTAHEKGIRIILDAVVNHTGPVTELDPVWEDSWVRMDIPCTYENYEKTVTCNLAGLPDIKTESTSAVTLPQELVTKWQNEGRYEQEMGELDAFFLGTGYPRLPKYYIMKWLADYITDFGIDGYRVDTVKHTEETVWNDFRDICDAAFENWKTNSSNNILDDTEFYLVGEAYDYYINSGKYFIYPGETIVNYFDNGFNSLINFDFQRSAGGDYETLFARNDWYLRRDLMNYGVLNFLSSHDDTSPFDKNRSKSYETANKLLLAPGTAQIYYGDETARTLNAAGAEGDATLRSMMNWDDIANNSETQEILTHWQKLGKFRKNHPSVGAGTHKKLTDTPYTFQRTYTDGNYQDKIIVGLDLPSGIKKINTFGIFKNGTVVKDAYSGFTSTVSNEHITIESEANIVLLAKN